MNFDFSHFVTILAHRVPQIDEIDSDNGVDDRRDDSDDEGPSDETYVIQLLFIPCFSKICIPTLLELQDMESLLEKTSLEREQQLAVLREQRRALAEQQELIVRNYCLVQPPIHVSFWSVHVLHT